MIKLSPATLLEAYSHAEMCYPEECCGLIFANGHYHRGDNIQNALHKAHPEIYARDAKNGFTLSPNDLKLLNRQPPSEQERVVAIVHSHPDVGAYFSEEDQRKSLYLGQPIYDVDYLVIDTRVNGSQGAALFRFNGVCYVDADVFDATGR